MCFCGLVSTLSVSAYYAEQADVSLSSVIIGIGGPGPVEEGSYVALYPFEEEIDYEWYTIMPLVAFEQSYFSLSGSYLYDYADMAYELEDYESYTFELSVSNMPDGMRCTFSGDSASIAWTPPVVTEDTVFGFDYNVDFVAPDGEILESVSRTVTITVKPVVSLLDDNHFMAGGLRLNDPFEFYGFEYGDVLYTGAEPFLWFGFYDETDNYYDLPDSRFVDLDPRFLLLHGASWDWYGQGLTPSGLDTSGAGWGIAWNPEYPKPIRSEIVPFNVDAVRQFGEQRRVDPIESQFMLYGYDYEDSRIEASTPVEDRFWGLEIAAGDDWRFVSDESGFVDVFQQQAGEWEYQQTVPDVPRDYNYAVQLAYANGVLAVSSPNYWSEDLEVYGAIFLYREEGGVWTQFQTLYPDVPEHAEQFGGSIDLAVTDSHFTLMASADGGYSRGTHTGAVWVYTMDPESGLFDTDAVQILLPDDVEEYDYFGWPLALEGDVAVIAANEDDDVAPKAGAAYVYRRDSVSGLWQFEQKLTASDGREDDLFAERLAICDQGIIVGAFRRSADDSYDEVGAAYFFQYNEGIWQETQRIRTVEEQATYIDYAFDRWSSDLTRYMLKRFGWSIEAEGDTLLITGERKGYGWDSVDRPVVYHFEWDSTQQQWVEQRTLCASDTDVESGLGIVYNFGVPMAISTDDILIGDPTTEDGDLRDAGAVFVFDRTIPVENSAALAYQQFAASMQASAPELADPLQDADGDGGLNVLEFLSGSNALNPSDAPLRQFQFSGTEDMRQPQYQFSQRLDGFGGSPAFFCSHSLASDSWYRITDPKFSADQIEDGIRIRTLDLTDEVIEGQPLFIKQVWSVPE